MVAYSFIFSTPTEKKITLSLHLPLPSGPPHAHLARPSWQGKPTTRPLSLTTARAQESQSPCEAWAASRAQLRAEGPGERLGAREGGS